MKKMRLIAPLAMAATAAAIGFRADRRGRFDRGRHTGQRAGHRFARSGGAAGWPAAVPVVLGMGLAMGMAIMGGIANHRRRRACIRGGSFAFRPSGL